MYTTIAQTQNINIEASSVLLDTISTERGSYQYKEFYVIVTTTSTIYPEVYYYI